MLPNIYMTHSRQEKKISRSEVFLLPRFVLRNDARPGCPWSVLVSDAGAERVCTKHLSRVYC